ncbi:unnamed protein product, partial [Amoebophrya sp. A25]|eukprot:GSA25T00008971001.1
MVLPPQRQDLEEDRMINIQHDLLHTTLGWLLYCQEE